MRRGAPRNDRTDLVNKCNGDEATKITETGYGAQVRFVTSTSPRPKIIASSPIDGHHPRRLEDLRFTDSSLLCSDWSNDRRESPSLDELEASMGAT